MSGIKFRNPSENSPYIIAGLYFLSWVFFNIFIFFILGKMEVNELFFQSILSAVIFGAFGLFTLIVFIAYLMAKKYKKLFLTIALLIVIAIVTQAIEFILLPYKMKIATGAIVNMLEASAKKSENEKNAVIEKDQVIFEYHYEKGENSIRVAGVSKTGFGAKLNIAVGDVLKTLNGEEINELNKAYAILPELRCTTASALTIQRGSQSYNVSLLPASQLMDDNRRRQVIKYFIDGKLQACHEYDGLSDQQLKNYEKNCMVNTQTCKVTDERKCPIDGAVLECARGRVERESNPLKIVAYFYPYGRSLPSTFLKCQCQDK